MYKAIEYFTDLKDNEYEYKAGDTYPRKGYEPSEERIAELASDKNKRGRAVIELVVASKIAVIDEPAEAPVEEEKEEAEEQPKKRSRKK